MQKNLYFIAVLPPADIQEQITGYKHVVANQFGSKHALKSPPHITIIPPFRQAETDILDLGKGIKKWCLDKHSFELQLRNFGCFEPRVIFVDVIENRHLISLHADLQKHLRENWGLVPENVDRFHPHMTIGFKDLKPRAFYEAWKFFRPLPYQASFLCRGVCLLVHTQGKWKLTLEIPFGKR